MASFFSNSENERDTLQLTEPLPNTFSEGLLPGNMMMYMNNYSSSSGIYSSPLPVNNTDSNHSHQEIMSQIGTSSRIEGNVLNEWKEDSRSNLMLMHQLENAASVGGVFQGQQGQGLSLTLGTHVPSDFHMSSFQNHSFDNQSLDRIVHSSTTNQESRRFDYHVPASNFDLMRSDVSPYGIVSSTRSVPSPKYLKAAQELLDEVVNVKTAVKEQNSKSKENDERFHQRNVSSPKQQESSSNSPAAELSASDKHDLQNKLTKLFEMLDEVDKRYKQYYHQMQIVVSSFDIVAGGSGASKPYTALALQTISRHFRCLRDAISEQIQTARKGLGDQDGLTNSKGIGISRLKYIDQHIRQGRGIQQQLGMMQQHNAWRPQRGLPESSVTILRAWLFEHFLHPYPKDSDKMMLARQTGLSRSQVSNWFINARVRLWKPMVEEIYKEELGDVEMDANSPSEFVAKASSNDTKASEDRGDDLKQSTTSTCVKNPSNLSVFDPQSCHLSDTHWTESRTGNKGLMETGNVFVQSNESSDNRLMAAAAYHMGRFENGGNGVSLTLGLQQCEGGSNVPMSIESHENYGSMRDGMGMYSTTVTSVEGGEYDCLDSGNRHHRFSSSSQLLHDFVA